MSVSKRDLRKEKNREAILEAALTIAREEGWEKVTIRKIADRILYTPPIVYEHFKNKDDLLHQLIKQGYDELRASTLAAVKDSDPPRERIKNLMKVRLKFNMDRPTLHQLMFDFSLPEWQREQAYINMRAIASLALKAFKELTGGSQKEVQGYFMNMVALVMGYTMIVSNFMGSNAPPPEFFQKLHGLTEEPAEAGPLPLVLMTEKNGNERALRLFEQAIDRFLDSIKNAES